MRTLPWPADSRYLQTGDLLIDLRYRRATCGDVEVELPQRLFDLLLLLMAEPHTLHSRAELFARLWPGVIVEDANLSQSMWLLRKALGEERKHWVHTVAKGGYVFEPPGPIEWFTELPGTAAARAAMPVAQGLSPDTGPATDIGATDDAAATTAAGSGIGNRAEGANSPPARSEDVVLPMSAAASPTTVQPETAPPPGLRGPPRHGILRRWKSAVAVIAMLGLVAVAFAWLRNEKQQAIPATLAPLTVALVTVQDPGAPAQWPATLLYEWLNWKLGGLPEVIVLTEAELAAGMGSTPAHIVFLASGEAPDAPGKMLVRARFQKAGREQQIELEGTAGQMPAKVDALSAEIIRRLIPARTGPWPELELDARAASRYADAAKATERRDWMAAAAIGEEVVKLAPRFGLARLQLANAQSRLAQATSAVEQMDAARDLLQPVPTEVAELLDAQRLAVDPRRYQQAAEAYGKLVARYPDKTAYAIRYAALLARTGELQQALSLLRAHDRKQAPMGTRIARLLALADIHEALGDPERMRQNARAALRLAQGAGKGWELESGQALLMAARADEMQQGPSAGKVLYEQAAKQFETAGNPTAALFARFRVELAALPSAGPNPRLDTLLAQAQAGGYRALEITILLNLANQHHQAGDLAGYRRRLEQAAGIAQTAGDRVALTRLDLILVYEDYFRARLDSADARVQRLRGAGLEGTLASALDQLEAGVSVARGNNAHAVQVLDRALRTLPAVKPGEPLSKEQMHLHCVRAEARLPLGDLAGARADLKHCAAATSPEAQTYLMLVRAGSELLAGDRVEAGNRLRRAQELLPGVGAGPARWGLAIEAARLLTRLDDPAASDRLYQSLLPSLRTSGYTLMSALTETGLAENAAARGDWVASQRHAAAARKGLPADAWAVTSRLDLLDIAAALAADDQPRAVSIAIGLHGQAHRLGDAITQMQVHSLMPLGSLPDDSRAHRETLSAHTGMRGATLDWLKLRDAPADAPVARKQL